jgi:hypothetical protein
MAANDRKGNVGLGCWKRLKDGGPEVGENRQMMEGCFELCSAEDEGVQMRLVG